MNATTYSRRRIVAVAAAAFATGSLSLSELASA